LKVDDDIFVIFLYSLLFDHKLFISPYLNIV